MILAVTCLLIAGFGSASSGLLLMRLSAQESALHAQARDSNELRVRIAALNAKITSDPDWVSIASATELAVVTIETAGGLGSGWVVRSDAFGGDVVTNFHVIAEALEAGDAEVRVRQADRSFPGTITIADRANDLALVRVAVPLQALKTGTTRPQLGAPVMVVGSPLGLAGTVSVGVVSGHRSVGGSDYIQFSAPISPGNSGGPVVDRDGRVVAVASAKFEGDGVEGLSLAIPIQNVCTLLPVCTHP